jgi:type I restriction-modification system DNA methylase subunit
MIYQQFLHLPDKPDSDDDDEHSEGRKAGAYYTPIPVVNYMLAEMDKRRQLRRSVRVFDPSRGSGAFLVQCYRRLIEREFISRKKKPAPHELATLLKRHIFGVDMDEDACSVAEFSLYLTLLDYVEPTDLINHPRFRLPTLRKKISSAPTFSRCRRLSSIGL